MIALVTGASGFIGSHLVQTLREAGHEVRTLPTALRRALPPDADFARDPIWDGVTHLFHLAARTRAPHRQAFHEANVVLTQRLVAAARAQWQPPQVILVSSLAATGPAVAPDRPRTEDDAPSPIERYGRSKLAAERVLQDTVDLPWTIMRPPAVYGPNDRDFLTLFRQLQRPLHWRATPGWHALTLAHVTDVVGALLAVAHEPRALGVTFHIGGDDCRWDALYEAIGDALHDLGASGTGTRRRSIGLPLPPPLLTLAGAAGGLWARVTGHVPLANPDKIALGRAPWWLSSGARLSATTGWTAQQALADGLRETARWYRTNRWL